MKKLLFLLIASIVLCSCGSGGSQKQETMEGNYSVQLMTVDPGHFHAALVQKSMYDQVSPDVYVYAPEGPDVESHLSKIKGYNERQDDPTAWNEVVYYGDDFFENMISNKKGNVVVLAGNNQKKVDYILESVKAGLNVLADKPMVISSVGYPKLEEAFKVAQEKGVLLYDIMTERYEVTTILQKMISQNKEVFGTLVNGTPEDPAVSKVSVHHFSKMVSGSPLQRPPWFFDVEQQGEGIVDVTCHLVDLVQWECFPEVTLSPSDVNMVSAKRWPTVISAQQFKDVTGLDSYPEYLQKDVNNGSLDVFANGEMIYQLKGVYAKVSVEWHFMPPEGGGDTHYSVMRGTQCDVAIKQGAEEKYVATLYVENIKGSIDEFLPKLNTALASFPYEGLTAEVVGNSIRVNIPDKYRVTHEEHFAQVTKKYLEYLEAGALPEWEVPNMLTKYYTNMSALKMAKGL